MSGQVVSWVGRGSALVLPLTELVAEHKPAVEAVTLFPTELIGAYQSEFALAVVVGFIKPPFGYYVLLLLLFPARIAFWLRVRRADR